MWLEKRTVFCMSLWLVIGVAGLVGLGWASMGGLLGSLWEDVLNVSVRRRDEAAPLQRPPVSDTD